MHIPFLVFHANIEDLQGSISMVEFEYQPWKKIIVHDVMKFPLEHFKSTHSLGVQQGGVGIPLIWADGIVFDKNVFRDTDDIIKEKLEGKVHWSSLSYAIMEKYQSEFKVEGSIRIPVMNVGDNVVFRKMAEWIKNNFEKK